MIDMRVRPRLQWMLQPIGRALANLGVSPLFMTITGVLITGVGAVLIAFHHLRIGALVALVGSALDGLDGSVARAGGEETAKGAFLDAAMDRVGEVAAFTGLAVAVAGAPRLVLLIVLALGGSMLVPYLRAKAESVGLNGQGGLMGRAERVILFTVGLLLGLVEPMLWLMVITTWLTVGQRFFDIYRTIEP